MAEFGGFPAEFFAFFGDLAANNDRQWFGANKERYRAAVVEPMSGFIAAMAPRLGRVSPHFIADPRPNGGSMFRIHRDVRFAKDKRPYKEHGACQFRHERGRDAHAPGFYVHLAPDGIVYGGGIWKPPSPALQRIREAIAHDPSAWRKVVRNRRLVDCFGGIEGEALKRAPRGFPQEHPHIEDIKRKSFFAMRRAAASEARSADFVADVERAFRAATPLMRFLCAALGVPF